MGVIVRSDRGTDRAPQSSSDDRTVPSADFIADCGTRRTADTAANRRIQGGIAGKRLNGHKRKRHREIFHVHSHRECPEKLDMQLIIVRAL